jgi:hypothetical protein
MIDAGMLLRPSLSRDKQGTSDIPLPRWRLKRAKLGWLQKKSSEAVTSSCNPLLTSFSQPSVRTPQRRNPAYLRIPVTSAKHQAPPLLLFTRATTGPGNVSSRFKVKWSGQSRTAKCATANTTGSSLIKPSAAMLKQV